MTSIGAGSELLRVQSANPALNESLAALNTEDFLQLLITQLTHQDPTKPMENKEILEQLTALRNLESNTQLTNSLTDLGEQYRVGTAAALIGREVLAYTDAGARVSGVVTRVLVGEDGIRLTVRGEADETYAVRLSSVFEIGGGEGEGDSSTQ